MIKSFTNAAAVAIASAAIANSPAYAEEAPSDITITGSVALTSQYRLRGVSLTDEDMAVQGSITVAHTSGFYAGTWASNLSGFGSFGGSNLELDLIGGYSTEVAGTTVDGGLVWYLYPGTSGTDYAEVYASVAAPVGPAKAKLGAYYAPKQQAIGSADALYLYTDWALPIANTPIALKAHAGYATGKGSALTGPDGDIIDYAVGVDLTWKAFTLNVSYVDTDIKKAAADAFYGVRGHSNVDGAVIATLSAGF